MADLEHVDIETRAELDKLHRLLGLPSGQLADLAEGGAANVRELREHIHRSIFNDRRERFASLANLTRLLPAGTVAKLAVSAFGPRLSGRVVGEMNANRASRIASRMEPEFLAEVAPHVDPPQVRDLVGQLPTDLILNTALLLVDREEYVVLGRFADALSTTPIRAVVDAVADPALLHIAFYMEQKSQLTRIVSVIDKQRVAGIMRTGMQRELWSEALSIIDNVDEDMRGRLANIMAEQEESVLNELVGVAHAQNLWGPILRGLACMDSKYYRKIVNLPAVRDHEVLADLINAAHAQGLLETALPLAGPMRREWQRVVAHAALQQGEEIAESALWAAQATDRWDIALKLCSYTTDDERNMLARLPNFESARLVESVAAAGILTNSVDLLLDILARMDEAGQRVAAAVMVDGDGGILESLLDGTDSETDLGIIATVLSRLDAGTLDAAAAIHKRQDDASRKAFVGAARNQGVWDTLEPVLEADAA